MTEGGAIEEMPVENVLAALPSLSSKRLLLRKLRRQDLGLDPVDFWSERAIAGATFVAARGGGFLRRNGGRIVHGKRAQTCFFERRLQTALACETRRIVRCRPDHGLGARLARQSARRRSKRSAPNDEAGAVTAQRAFERGDRPAIERRSPRGARDARERRRIEHEHRHDRAVARRLR